MIVCTVQNLWISFYSFPNCKIEKICYFLKLYDFSNLMILEIVKFRKFFAFSRL